MLRPRGVAVVGASADPSKRGHQAVRALRESGYGGAVHPVNPKGGEVLGLRAARSIDDLPGPVDLALVCTPAGTAPEVVEACGRAGVPAAVLLAVGFGESGEEGRRLEARTLEAARRGGVRLVGPNTSGVMNLPSGLNLIGARGVRTGSLALVTQSGNLTLDLMLQAGRRSAVGLSVCVGVGNELDLGFPDFLEWLAVDEGTRAVVVHAEGFRRGPETLAAAARLARRKPVVLIKGARTAASASAALSHTGAVAGPYRALSEGLRQAGVHELTRSDELFHVAETLAAQRPAAVGTGVAVLSDGGGQGTLAVDLLEDARVPRADLAPPTREALRSLLGSAAAVTNPVDLAGAADRDPGVFVRAARLLADDPGVGALLVVGLFGGYARRFDDGLGAAETEAARALAGAMGEAGVGVVVHSMYAPDATAPLMSLREVGVPVVESLEVSVRCVGALVERGRALAWPAWTPLPPASEAGPSSPDGSESPEAAEPGTGVAGHAPRSGDGRRALSEPEARGILDAAGVPLVPATLCHTVEETLAAADAVAGPVVVKLVAPGVVHKSDVGGVALDVEGEAAVREAWTRVRGDDGGASALVSPMLGEPVAELLVGVRRDEAVGRVLSVGAGGLWVEAMGDVAVRILPAGEDEMAGMLRELRVWPVLRGGRGRAGGDVSGVVATLGALARLLEVRAEVLEAEVNPLFVYPDRVVGVDARVVVAG